jgi:HSP20 family protein
MRVIHWEPFRDIDGIFERFVADALRRVPRDGAPAAPGSDWAPLADVTESASEYLIKADLPEVRKEDVSITVQDGVLTLSGERKHETPADTERTHRIERTYGTFSRRFALPEDADEQSISAEGRDGVILIHVPKQKVVQPQPRQIAIQ